MKMSYLLWYMLVLITGSVHAATSSQTVNFRGTLLESPGCVIDGGVVIDVDFGDKIGINKVDGTNYLRPIPYTLNCPPGPIPPLVLSLAIKGTPADFDENAIQSSKPDLAVRLLRNGIPLKVNEFIPLDALNPPLLSAVPVGRPNAVLTEGRFDAMATLLAGYQ